MDSHASNRSTPRDNVSSALSNIIIRRDYDKTTSVTSIAGSDDRNDAKRLKRSHRQPTSAETTSMDAQSSQPAFPTIVTQNLFETLSTVDPDGNVNNTSQPPQSLPSTTKKSRRPPPITIVNKGTKHTRELLNLANIPQTGYHLKAVKSGTQLNTADECVFDAAVKLLQESNTEFFSYTPSHQQPVRIILSGLSLYDVAELKEELLLNEVRPVEVKIFSRKKSGPEESVLYLLCFDKGSVKLAGLQKVKTLFSTMVTWRYFTKKPDDSVQCHRCQRFGHGMRFCNITPLCVKCGEKHLTANCKLPVKANLKDASSTRSHIRCANCSGNHTANYRGCPSRLSYIKQLEEHRQRASKKSSLSSPRPPTTSPRYQSSERSRANHPSVAVGLSYSQVLQGPAQAGAESSSNLFSVSEFLCLARDLFHRLQGCRTKEQQFLALSELIIKYVYND